MDKFHTDPVSYHSGGRDKHAAFNASDVMARLASICKHLLV